MADFEESYLVAGSALARIGRVTREVETNLGLKPPEHRRKRIPLSVFEGEFTETLQGTNDPDAPTTAKFQIKTSARSDDSWKDEDEPSIVPVINRTGNKFEPGDRATVIELYPNKYFAINECVRRRVVIIGSLAAPTTAVPTTGLAAGLDYDPTTKEITANDERYIIHNWDDSLTADDGTFAKIEYMEGAWDIYWASCSPKEGFTGLPEDPEA